MFKKFVFILLTVSTITTEITAQSATGEPPNSTARESGNIFSQLSAEIREIKVLTWRFVRAAMSADYDTMRSLAVPETKIHIERNVFDDQLEFMLLSEIRPTMGGRYVDPGADFDAVEVSYEISIIDRDYYTYLTMHVRHTEDGWRVFEYTYQQ